MTSKITRTTLLKTYAYIKKKCLHLYQLQTGIFQRLISALNIHFSKMYYARDWS